MGESKATLSFDFPESVEIELSDEALELAVPEKGRSDLGLH